MTARPANGAGPVRSLRRAAKLAATEPAGTFVFTLAASAVLTLWAGGASADVTSTGCAELLSSANLAQPMETMEDPSGDLVRLVNPSAQTDAGVYRLELYGSGAEDILYLGGPENGLIAGDGDDRIFAFDAEAPGYIGGEGGADTVVFCSIGAPFSGVTLNSGVVGADSEPDTLVLGPDVFRAAAAFGRNVIPFGGVDEEIDGALILVAGFDPRSDRIVLRPPWPVELRHERRNTYDHRIHVGPLQLVFSFSEEGLDPVPAVSVSMAPSHETIAGLDLDALLAARRAQSGTGGGGLWGWLEGHGGDHGDDHGDDHGGDGGGEGHGADFQRLDGARAAAMRCGDFFDPSALDTAVQDQEHDAFDARESTWRDDADTLAYFGDGEPQYLMAGGGDDLIWLFDVEEGTEIVAGDGSDLVILCSVEDISAVVWFGRSAAAKDDEPDTLVIAQEVLDDVPSGFQRIVNLHEYDPLVDRLVLPPGPWQLVIEMRGAKVSPNDTAEVFAFDAKIFYGPIRVGLSLGQPTDPATLYHSISVGDTDPSRHIRDLAARRAGRITPAAEFRSVDPSTWDGARTLAGGVIGGVPPVFDCSAPPAATERPRKPELDEHDALMVEYGDTNDVIVVRNMLENPETGFLSQSEIRSGAGTDIVYSYSGNATLIDGPGFDLAVICDMDGLWTGIESPSDGSPDIVIIDAAVFRKPVTKGFDRTISISGYGEAQDYLILRLPAGARIEPDRYLPTRFSVVTPEATTWINLGAAMNENPDTRLHNERMVVWPE